MPVYPGLVAGALVVGVLALHVTVTHAVQGERYEQHLDALRQSTWAEAEVAATTPDPAGVLWLSGVGGAAVSLSGRRHLVAGERLHPGEMRRAAAEPGGELSVVHALTAPLQETAFDRPKRARVPGAVGAVTVRQSCQLEEAVDVARAAS